MGKKTFGCLGFTFFVSVILLCIGGFLIYQAPGKASLATTIASLDPVSAATIGGATPGEMVVVAGQIDPQTPAARRGLAMYVEEEYVRETRRNSNGRRTTSYEWERRETVAPAFTLGAPDGDLRIVIEGYELDTPTFDEKGKNDVGALRYEGFKPGDQVLVVGAATDGGIAAETVFGGTQEQYVAALRTRSANDRRIGMGLLACGALPFLAIPLVGFVLWRRGRSADASTAVDTTGDTVPSMSLGGAEVTPAPVSAQLTCPHCGSPLIENATFCGGCGSRVDLPAAAGS